MATGGFICRACRLKAESTSIIKSFSRPFLRDYRYLSTSYRRLGPRRPGSFISGWDKIQSQTSDSNHNEILQMLGVNPGLMQDSMKQDDTASKSPVNSTNKESYKSSMPIEHYATYDPKSKRTRTQKRSSKQLIEGSQAPLTNLHHEASEAKKLHATQKSTFGRKLTSREASNRNLNQTAKEETAQSSHFESIPRQAQSAATAHKSKHAITLKLNGSVRKISPIALRELCSCTRCVDPSTKQKLYNVAEIPANIQAKSVSPDGESIHITWQNDLLGFPADHTTTIEMSTISNLYEVGPLRDTYRPEFKRPIYWTSHDFEKACQDISYKDYMEDDRVLFKALQQLLTHGLVFLTGVPEAESSVSTIAERIGPLKETFYGRTWDVRSVPQAKNVAYTSQDLGFHMDLLYMEQPPHLQFLHCIRASNAGGASLFTDSHRAAKALWEEDPSTVNVLSTPNSVGFHYRHYPNHHYEQSHATITGKAYKKRDGSSVFNIKSVAWSPPFQSPLSYRPSINVRARTETVEGGIDVWCDAAKKLNKHFHNPEGIYERMMKPGECAIFDNRRVLHARTAFQVGDVGKERWLRGCYLDKDPFMSKTRVLGHRLLSEDLKRT